jgi:hypothetical protein
MPSRGSAAVTATRARLIRRFRPRRSSPGPDRRRSPGHRPKRTMRRAQDWVAVQRPASAAPGPCHPQQGHRPRSCTVMTPASGPRRLLLGSRRVGQGGGAEHDEKPFPWSRWNTSRLVVQVQPARRGGPRGCRRLARDAGARSSWSPSATEARGVVGGVTRKRRRGRRRGRPGGPSTAGIAESRRGRRAARRGFHRRSTRCRRLAVARNLAANAAARPVDGPSRSGDSPRRGLAPALPPYRADRQPRGRSTRPLTSVHARVWQSSKMSMPQNARRRKGRTGLKGRDAAISAALSAV